MEWIDPAQWKRKPLCDFFGELDFPFFGVTFRVDMTTFYTRAKAAGLPIYYATIYSSMRAANQVEPFLYKIRGDKIVRHPFLSPSFTAPADDGLFRVVNVEWLPNESAADFCARAKEADKVQTNLLPSPEDEARDDFVYISCLPWLDFTMITQEMALNRDDSIPRLTWGKIVEENGRRTMAYAIQVNHRVSDGQHIGAFAEALQRELDHI